MTKETQVISVRLPAELHHAITVEAARDHRSINGEIIHLLSNALNQLVLSRQDKEAAAGNDPA